MPDNPVGLTIGADELGRLLQPDLKRPGRWLASSST